MVTKLQPQKCAKYDRSISFLNLAQSQEYYTFLLFSLSEHQTFRTCKFNDVQQIWK